MWREKRKTHEVNEMTQRFGRMTKDGAEKEKTTVVKSF